MAVLVAPIKAPPSPSSVAVIDPSLPIATASTKPHADDSMRLVSVPHDLTLPPLTSQEKNAQELPWYRAGGMEVNLNGMAANTAVSLYVLIRHTTIATHHGALTLSLWLMIITMATILTGRTIYCSLALPTFVASLGIAAFLPYHPALLLITTLALALTKVNICMSVCLHRYAAHQAFTCGPITKFGVLALGCLANQGGPIWWSSQHRCHHKFCDLPRDPHSPTQVGTEKAFAFFGANKLVNEEFVPRHLNGSILLRLLDTWAWTVVACELVVAYHVAGRAGLFCCYSSGWLSQAITLWFNVANHPVVAPVDGADTKRNACTATDERAPMVSTFYLPFYLLDMLSNSFLYIVMEGEHDHHHNHSMLAKRSATDVAYWGFVRPLEMAGLVWNVVVKE